MITEYYKYALNIVQGNEVEILRDIRYVGDKPSGYKGFQTEDEMLAYMTALNLKEFIPINEEQLRLQGWQHPEYAKRIVAPMELIMDDIGIKMYGWFQINGFPVVTVAPFVHLYCNVILEAHQFVIDSFQGYITIEDRPTP